MEDFFKFFQDIPEIKFNPWNENDSLIFNDNPNVSTYVRPHIFLLEFKTLIFNPIPLFFVKTQDASYCADDSC